MGPTGFAWITGGFNAVTRLDSYPLPRIEDLLDQLHQTRYFTSLDLASGYWQIQVHQESIPKTAFITPQGLYEFKVMPFGLTNAPSAFQRLMQGLLTSLNPPDGSAFVSVYTDDILIYSRTMEEHLTHLRLVLDRLRLARGVSHETWSPPKSGPPGTSAAEKLGPPERPQQKNRSPCRRWSPSP